MTKYTAADFANAKFAEHEDGRTAMKPSGHTRWDVKLLDGRRSVRGNCHMASFGWVPVPTKPQITESQYKLALDEDRDPQYVYGFTDAMRRLGGEVIPDPEPTNKDKLANILVEAFNSMEFDLEDSFREIAAVLDKNGVTAPNVKGN